MGLIYGIFIPYGIASGRWNPRNMKGAGAVRVTEGRQRAKVKRQKAKGKRQRAKGKRQKAKGKR